jgi:hypothetical protein
MDSEGRRGWALELRGDADEGDPMEVRFGDDLARDFDGGAFGGFEMGRDIATDGGYSLLEPQAFAAHQGDEAPGADGSVELRVPL